jgi:hypothetical protein
VYIDEGLYPSPSICNAVYVDEGLYPLASICNDVYVDEGLSPSVMNSDLVATVRIHFWYQRIGKVNIMLQCKE